MTSHNKLIQQAKQNQVEYLKKSSLYSKQLINTIYTLIKSNSSDNATTSSVIDKITTIHQLDHDIDIQLNELAKQFDGLDKCKRDLQVLISRCNEVLYSDGLYHEGLIDVLQRRVEGVDRELRILEHTVKIIKDH
jgi:hypothetical protein